ncbi:MAG TPA: sigma 54-interacting transcriptional regulator [Bacteroidales bacterium]|nr:sigma 54-interacting transcriptional regulator [Bacteroidales bacterium]
MRTAYTFPNKSLLHEIEKSSKSFLMQDIAYKILRLAKTNSNVILVGEIGSEKKNLARIIHENSKRAEGPFFTYYCLNIDEQEYKKAFWGHLQLEGNHLCLKYDLLEKTTNGTLYLDKFSDLSPAFMHNILVSYHKGCQQLFRHSHNKKAKPRLILSFNQKFYYDIMHQPVWEKLLNKLNAVVIMVPPLREHKEDIPLIVDYFLEEIKTKRTDFTNLKISGDALLDCFNYDWPGNLLQLKNAILQGAILSRGRTIESRHLPFSISLG